MAAKKRIPPEDVIREDSGPTVTEVEEPKPKRKDIEIDIDDASIQPPKDHVFQKGPKRHKLSKKAS